MDRQNEYLLAPTAAKLLEFNAHEAYLLQAANHINIHSHFLQNGFVGDEGIHASNIFILLPEVEHYPLRVDIEMICGLQEVRFIRVEFFFDSKILLFNSNCDFHFVVFVFRSVGRLLLSFSRSFASAIKC